MQLKEEAMFQCFKWDIQSDNHCVLARYPLILRQEQWKALGKLAEGLYDETLLAERELLEKPELHEALSLPRKIRKLLTHIDHLPAEAARVMRFDFHLTEEGWRISEVNADVPGGYIESSGVTERIVRHYPGLTIPGNPSEALAQLLHSTLKPNAVVAMVHATIYFDDHQVMRFLGRHLTEREIQPIFVAPNQLRWSKGRAQLCQPLGGHPIDAIVRFYPAEWLASLKSDCTWEMFFRDSSTPMSNPATAIVVQSKRFPLVWNELRTEMKLWRSLLPETRAIEDIPDLGDWVIKPIFGRVGEDVAMAGCTPQPRMQATIQSAKKAPKQWIAQRRFQALPLEGAEGKVYPTVGVFVIDGKAVGAYGRIAHKPLIDNEAQDIAVLVDPGGQS